MIDRARLLGENRFGRLLGRVRLHAVMILAIALTVSIWAPTAVAGSGANPADANGAALDTAAILTLAENAKAVDGQIDDPGDGSYAIVHRMTSALAGGLAADDTGAAARSHNDSALLHKTGPPTRA